MRVLIKLWGREPVETGLGACIFQPETVVYLCDERDSAFLKEAAVYRLFRRRKMRTQPRFYYFDGADAVGIRRVLLAVVRDYPGCVFDFTGGRDLVLLIAGMCFSEMCLPGFYIDLYRERFLSLRGCEDLAKTFALPAFSAEDIFAMTGAALDGYGHFHTVGINEAFERDILAVFGLVLKSPRAWSELVAFMQGLCSGFPANALTVEGPRRGKSGRNAVRANPVLLEALQKAGVLTQLRFSRHRVEISFKSALHRKCLLIEGVWLELYCYVTARRGGAFNDVRTSVVVDWDGVLGGSDNAKNEIDVFLVRGVTPVFISCKMSLPTAQALSEIRLLATRFGGAGSRAVVLTAGSLAENHKALYTRAQELDIQLLGREVLAGGSLDAHLRAIAAVRAKNEPRLVDSAMLPGGSAFKANHLQQQ